MNKPSLDNYSKVIISLYDYTGNWSEPYKKAGYDVRRVDIKHGQDVRLLEYPGKVHGVLAAPPCTALAGSGARWWKEKGEKALADALALTDACLRFVVLARPEFWVLENPVGRLRRYYGPPTLIFNPCDYGDPYTKKTLLWGDFNLPEKNPVPPTEGSKMHLIPPGPDRQAIRSATPKGFAQAFFEANQ